ncbi:MAG: orotate phosphoribosyltransferase [Bacteroidia bacterium]
MSTAEEVAGHLLKTRAVKLARPGQDQPFTWASGWKSPIYCDNRITLSYPIVRSFIKDKLSQAIIENYNIPEVIAGVATGAIAQGALVAEKLNLPFIYIRSSAKAHGMTNMIEGELKAGQKVVVIEDLVSTGKSSLAAVEALRQAGADVLGMVAIFSYGFDAAVENFKAADCRLVTLSNYNELIKLARKNDYISESDVVSLEHWRKSPQKWMQND